MSDLTYYQRNRDVILNRVKYYYGNDKERLRGKQETNTKTYLKKKKMKSENMEVADTAIYQKKKTMAKRISKKLSWVKKVSQYNNE